MISPPEKQSTRVLTGNLAIRRMSDADVDGVMAIESVSFGSHHWSHESFYNELRNQMGRYYALVERTPDVDNERLIGYCGYWIILDEAHVTTVAISPDYRGQALGELMVLHMLERCQSQSVVWVTLEVRVSNYAAQNLYYKYGFQSAGIRYKYYQNNHEDALIMTTPDIRLADFRKTLAENRQALRARLGSLPSGFDR